MKLTDLQGAGRRAGVRAGRPSHLFQLGAQRVDADLADEAGRQRAGADHQRRLQQLVPAHLAGRPVDRLHQLSEGRRARPITRTTSASTCGCMPDRGRHAAGDRLRLRRPGHDQRAVVVARQPDAGVRQQHWVGTEPAISAPSSRSGEPALLRWRTARIRAIRIGRSREAIS